ncbi:MAG: arginine N-succinyltransferase [Halobacteriovorax sp.]|nr:arginine N-succinyltransferase [Halobacteriovorax sp.]|tara:strand:+ start:260919 stop:261944 length:1026 start_codon:yes stop_codon:yes gene_type:complete
MYYIRSVQESDLEDLFTLSQHLAFINLPPDKRMLLNKIRSSTRAFNDAEENHEDDYFIFVLIDAEKEKLIGVSMIHGKHGTEKEPHFYLTVGHEKKYSESINTGFIHGTLKLGIETDGWTEIGGLILSPEYRGNPNKLGKQLSFCRFLYMSQHSKKFTPVIHSELMPPLDEKGNSPLWEALGRRFMNMNYQEADKLSRENKEFILSLFPQGTIYETLLTPEARDSIGRVGRETEPVKKMLESIGFNYTNEVDPFDGGPHYRAALKDIKLVKDAFVGKLEKADNSESHFKKILINLNHKDFPFFSILANGKVDKGKISLDNESFNYIDSLKLENNDSYGIFF